MTLSKRKGRPPGIAIDCEVVRSARLRRCLTQIDLAEAAGLSARTIASVEAGDPIAPRTARAIASALQLELDRLLVGDAELVASSFPWSLHGHRSNLQADEGHKPDETE